MRGGAYERSIIIKGAGTLRQGSGKNEILGCLLAFEGEGQ